MSALQASIHLTHASIEDRTIDVKVLTKMSDEGEKSSNDWVELAIEDPLFKVTLVRVWDSNMYVVSITQQPPSKAGERNLEFEIVYPIYKALTEVTERKTTPKTTIIQLRASAREYCDAFYRGEFSPKQWCYQNMDEIMEALADQLTMKQNLNGGLLIQLSFHET